MNAMQVFQNSEFGELGVLEIDGKPYFPATACAKALGYANTKDAIIRHCKEVVKHDLPTKGGIQAINFIPEGDLYRLITHSKLPAAERFEKWVFDEVLPTIRKTGSYGNQTAMMEKLVEQLTQVTTSLTQVASVMTTTNSRYDFLDEEPRRKKRAISIKMHLFSGTAKRRRLVLEQRWKPMKRSHFTLRERGKVRPIDAPHVSDRQVHKTLCNNVLVPLYGPSMIKPERKGPALAFPGA